ncbi:DUF397 domain-containing protein [Streptomyces clavifer]|uniref:DUF397 domain-containing protein n=1 Tax=Streptomyces clavifer TaxID=68188 RepID=UPI0030850460|nr:DUF397 domain-containing protein [Streptomyces clavifer]
MLSRHDKLSEWTKSSYSAVNGDCVEVKAAGNSAVAVRDSKDPRTGILEFAAATWSAFLSDASRIS